MSEGTRYCWRCDEPILHGQAVVTSMKVSISAGGHVAVVHEQCPKPPAYVRRTP
ncbi:hypothetical protein ACFYO9_22385 [Streptomyces sp. NPDC005863]|uniref:hypothetical protein n=1 Tax=unclassified Streptomyces TaxID=2593676 RepID=UPI0033FE78A6